VYIDRSLKTSQNTLKRQGQGLCAPFGLWRKHRTVLRFLLEYSLATPPDKNNRKNMLEVSASQFVSEIKRHTIELGVSATFITGIAIGTVVGARLYASGRLRR
jgi:hypothetical protein